MQTSNPEFYLPLERFFNNNYEFYRTTYELGLNETISCNLRYLDIPTMLKYLESHDYIALVEPLGATSHDGFTNVTNKLLIHSIVPTSTWINEQSEEMQLRIVKYRDHLIHNIKNPSNKVQVEACKQNPNVLGLIKHQTEEAQLIAINANPLYLYQAENPSEAVQLAAVRQNGALISSIKNPSEAVQLVSIQQKASSIRLIDEPSEAAQLAAVKQVGNLISYIRNPSPEVQIAAVKQNGSSIRFISNPCTAAKMISDLLNSPIDDTGFLSD